MKDQFRHSPINVRGLLHIAGRNLVALAFILLINWYVDAVQNPQPVETTQNRRAIAIQKTSPANDPLSEMEIREARMLLDQLGYWVSLDRAGEDDSLRHALIAFRKIEGRKRTGILTTEDLKALRIARRPQALEQGYPHIEIDLARQVLLFIDYGDTTPRILPISSGSGEWFTEGGVTRRAITPTGRFKVYRK